MHDNANLLERTLNTNKAKRIHLVVYQREYAV